MSNQKDEFHFFASSAAAWKTDESLKNLIRDMDKDNFDYAIWYVPLPHESAYEIKFFKPQTEGCIYLGMYKAK